MPKIYAILLLFIVLVKTASAQDEISGEGSQQLVHEKIFLHIDRPAYVAGETMWFKIYVVDTKTHSPLDLSKVAYLEILDHSNKAILQTKVALAKGVGNGSVYLPLSINSGNYIVRAYTNWMKNFGNNRFFEEEITIINTMYSTSQPAAAQKPMLDVQFFPEGGDLVKEIRSKVAYRVVDQKGKGVDFEGAIINDVGDTLTLFRPDQFGIGYFYYTPQGNGSATAIIKYNDTIIRKQLPEAKEKGIVMELSDRSEAEIIVSVLTNQNVRERIQLKISSVHGNNFLKENELEGSKAVFSIEKALLDEGISVITCLDSRNNLHAERLYFKYPKDKLEIHIKSDKQLYSQREKINVDISLSGNERFSRSHLSLSVFKLDSLNTGFSSDIYSYLWLSSELNGKIEAPEYYFKEVNSSTRRAMDNLMLTHGWRKFENKKSSADEISALKYIPEYEGLTIKASLPDKSALNNFRDVPFYLSTAGKMSQLYGSKIDENGDIYFVTNSLYGKQKLVIQSASNVREVSEIKLEDPFSPEPSSTLPSYLNLRNGAISDLHSRHVHMQTQNIYWSAEHNRMAPIDSVNFYDRVDKTYFLDNYTRFPTMEEVLREYIPEVIVRKTGSEYYFRVLKAPHVIHLDNPLVLINNVPVFDINKIIVYNPLLIKQIDIIKDGYILEGEILLRGIVNFKSYQNTLEDVVLDPEAMVVDVEGLQEPRIFYSPMYGDDGVAQTKPDFRNLLFWEPSLIIKEPTTGSVSFYAGDLQGKYVGVIQGLDEGGNAGYSTFIIEIDAAQATKYRNK